MGIVPGSAGWRAALLVAAALAGLLVVKDGLARTATRSPAALALAARVAPGDAGVQASLAERALAADVQAGRSLAPAAAHARRALRADITRADALGVLGTVAQAAGDPDRAAAIMAASDALSRRDIVTRLWFVDDAVRRGTTAGALHHFDIALRTSLTAHRALFPILARAMRDERLVAPMVRLLRRRPAWGADFLYAAINTNQATRNIGAVYAALDPKPVHRGSDLGQLLIDTLVAQRDFAGADALDRRLRGAGGGTQLVVDPRFREATGRTPFTWRLTATEEFDAARAADPQGNPGLAVISTGSATGVVAEQLLALAPGRYSFTGIASTETPEPRAIPTWSLACADTGSVLGTQAPRTGRPAVWSVPAGCRFQWLRLRLDATDTMSGEDWFIGPVALAPVQASSR